MDFLNSWIQTIIISVIIATIIEMMLPSGSSKKYIKLVLGVYIVFNIITPVVNKISDNNFEILSVVNIEEYIKKMEKDEMNIDSIDVEEVNQSNIKQIYVSKLEKDMKSKLEEKNYNIKNIKIEVDNNDEYKIQNIEIYLDKNEENTEENMNEIEENLIYINEVETINIQISDEINNKINNEKNTEEKENNKISEKEEKEIKEYISSVYEIQKNKINIY